jgi:hypothetical protein
VTATIISWPSEAVDMKMFRLILFSMTINRSVCPVMTVWTKASPFSRTAANTENVFKNIFLLLSAKNYSRLSHEKN